MGIVNRSIIIDGKNIDVARLAWAETKYKGLRATHTGRTLKKFIVQYGIGASGEGSTLKEAVCNLATKS